VAGAASPVGYTPLQAATQRLSMLLLCVPAIAFIVVLLGIPTGWLFYLSFFDHQGFTLAHYERLLTPSYLRTMQTTVKVSVTVTLLTLAVGYPLAYLLSQLPRRVGNLLLLFVIIPFWTPLLVRTYGWMVILQRHGLVNETLIDLGIVREPMALMHNFTGTVIGTMHVMLPFLVLPLLGSMRAIDPWSLRAAATLGAGPARVFWTVFFPQSLPGLFAGCVLIFVLCIGFYITPALLGGGHVLMWAERIAVTVNVHGNWGVASALGVVLLVSTLVLLAIGRWVFSGWLQSERGET